jgi:hypothetical protein
MSYSDKLKNYLQAAKSAHSHAGKLIAFSELLKSVFGVSSYETVQNVEQYVKTGGLMVLKGRMDMRLGQTIIEFKIDLAKELETAIEEIERYTAILRKNGQKVAECAVKAEIKEPNVRTVEDALKIIDGHLLVAKVTKEVTQKPETETVNLSVLVPKAYLEYLRKLAPALGITVEGILKDAIYSMLSDFFSGGHLDGWLNWIRDQAGSPDQKALEESIDAIREY